MSQQDRRAFLKLIDPSGGWSPLAGPQSEAYYCEADELFYGGAAGGGKTDLICGLAHKVYYSSIIYRRQATQLTGIVDRLKQLVGTKGYNGQEKIFRLGERQIELGSVNNFEDREKYQGRAHGIKIFDEITHFLKAQYTFLCGWTRTTNPKEPKTRIVCTGNPPVGSDGLWVRERWGAWLDPKHPNPAKPGELRWYTTLNGKDTEVPSGEPFMHYNTERGIEELITPKSRTFIPAKVQDNPYLMATGYDSQLQALPEPLRSQMLYGDFTAGTQDDVWQVIPTQWVDDAMKRWREYTPPSKLPPMDSLGVDVACGGMDKTVLSPRHGNWFAPLKSYPGKSTPDGPETAGLVIINLRDKAPIHIDVIGWGKSAYDFLNVNDLHVLPCNAANKSEASSRGLEANDAVLRFFNKRAEWHWRMRENLDPANNMGIMLPDSPTLRADLICARWSITPRGVKIEPKEDIIDRLGRSPDEGDAVLLANICTPKRNLSDDLNTVPDAASYYE